MGAIHQVLLAGSRSYQYRRTVTIDHTKCGATDSSNFPVLFSGTYAYLATTANGGNVTSANGYDIIFTSDAAGTTKLDHEIETYTATTGAVNFWVRVPTVSHTTDTVIYLWYGNSAVTTSQENVTGVWDSNFKGVWHLLNGTTLTANDSTSNANNGTINGQVGTDMVGTGVIDGAAVFDGTDDYVSTNYDASGLTALTWSVWAKRSSTGAVFGPYISQSNASNAAQIGFSSDGNLYIAVGGGAYGYVASNDTSWHHIEMVYDGSQSTDATKLKMFVGGIQQTLSWSGSGVPTSVPTMTSNFQIGRRVISSIYTTGSIDEVRISNTARSADWITTEYNNQNSPSTFYTVGAAQ